MKEETNGSFKKYKALELFGLTLRFFGFIVVIQSSFITLEKLFTDKSMHISGVLYLQTYSLLAVIIIICGVGFRDVSRDTTSFFKQEHKDYIFGTEFGHLSFGISFISSIVIFIFCYHDEGARGQFTEFLSQFTFIVVVIYILVVYHYKKVIESQKNKQ